MANYDFTTLSPPEFENLTRDLLQEKIGTHIESFKDGRDQGIDLRHTTADGDRCVIQCKHYAKSGFPKLLSDLKAKEKPKIDKLRPAQCILCTSVPLSPANKNDIMRSLAPHVKGPEDVFGKDDMNNLLGQYDKIERRHFKLWMSSTAILTRVLHADIFNQTELGRELNVNPVSVAQWISERLSSHEAVYASDYLVAKEFYDEHLDCENAEAMTDQLRTDFETWISHEHVTIYTTATSLEYFIDEVEEVADTLWADIEDDIRGLKEDLDRLRADEEMEARDLEMGEQEDSRPGKRTEDISSVLGALKSE